MFFAENRFVFLARAERYSESADTGKAANDNDTETQKKLELADKIAENVQKGGFRDMKIEGAGSARNLSDLMSLAASPETRVDDLQRILAATESANSRNQTAEQKTEELLRSPHLSDLTRENLRGFLKAKQGADTMDTKMSWEWLNFVESQLKRQPQHEMATTEMKTLVNMPNAEATLANQKPPLAFAFKTKNGKEIKMNFQELQDNFHKLPLEAKKNAVQLMKDTLRKKEFDPNAEKERDSLLMHHGRKLPETWKDWLAHPEKNGDSLAYAVNWVKKQGLPEIETQERKMTNIQTSPGYMRAQDFAKKSKLKAPKDPTPDEFRGMNRTEREKYFEETQKFMEQFDQQFAKSMQDKEAKDVATRDVKQEQMKVSAEQEQQTEELALMRLWENLSNLSFAEDMHKGLQKKEVASATVIDLQSKRKQMAQKGMQVGEAANKNKAEGAQDSLGSKVASIFKGKKQAVVSDGTDAEKALKETHMEQKELHLDASDAARQDALADKIKGNEKNKDEFLAACGLKALKNPQPKDLHRLLLLASKFDRTKKPSVQELAHMLSGTPQLKHLLFEVGNLKEGARNDLFGGANGKQKGGKNSSESLPAAA